MPSKIFLSPILPFLLLLCMMATGPLLYKEFWEKHYKKIAVTLAMLIIVYYLFFLKNFTKPLDALNEYVEFIALISSIYVISGGILIEVNKKATPITNVIFLFIGACLANFISTTGASMLLIRPYIRLNKTNIKAYHIIFFIFIVSNIGGALSPIGDPPLFLGFLKGVPFFWNISYCLVIWLFTLFLLLVLFFFLDKKHAQSVTNCTAHSPTKISIKGGKNFIGLAIILASIFLDVKILTWIPSINYKGHRFSFLRELIMLTTAILFYKRGHQEALQKNQFSFEPIKEVAYLFFGIFFTMLPALELMESFARSTIGKNFINPSSLYWCTGALSAFLDNAPTYVNALLATMSAHNVDVMQPYQVKAYAANLLPNSSLALQAVSIAAVFFGAMTYIGNGPNFMVKAIAEQKNIQMPSFFSYLIRFSIPFLLPCLFLVWLLFFAF